jgi:putrescine importer
MRELNTEANPPHLCRVLKLWDLVFYGKILIQSIAPGGIFGISQKLSRGHVSTVVLAAMAAMMLTAFSYGRMTALYPSAGSAYTYASRGPNSHVG